MNRGMILPFRGGLLPQQLSSSLLTFTIQNGRPKTPPHSPHHCGPLHSRRRPRIDNIHPTPIKKLQETLPPTVYLILFLVNVPFEDAFIEW